jgi:hypothetical protein
MTDELMHYGVRGMRWGVRHDPRLTTTRDDRKWIRQTTTRKNWKEATDKYMENANAGLAKINANPKYKKLGQQIDFNAPENKKLQEEYHKEVFKLADRTAAKVAKDFGLSPDGEWKVAASLGNPMNPDSMTLLVIPSWSSMDIERETRGVFRAVHSTTETIDFSGFKVTLNTNGFGYVTSVSVDDNPDVLSHAEALMHYGVKGMRWGHRKSVKNMSDSELSAAISRKAKEKKLRDLRRETSPVGSSSVARSLKSGGLTAMSQIATVGVLYAVASTISKNNLSRSDFGSVLKRRV